MTDAPWPAGPLDIRLVVADMDGTLLDGEGAIPDTFWPMLKRMHDRGVVFAPASGRQYATLAQLFERASDGMAVIAENGAFVVRDGAELFSETLDRELLQRLVLRLRSLDGSDLGVVFSGKHAAYVERSDPAFVDEAAKYHVALTIVDDLLQVDDDVLKVAIFDFGDAETNIAPHLEDFRDTHQVVISGAHWIDVLSRGINKGVAVERLQAELGITREQTVAFGDYLNDIEMLDAAELSFAMQDAHPAVLEHARFRAPSHRDHGVVDILDRLIPAGATDNYRAARDLLVDLREDYAGAVERFRWPDVGQRFNWAIDWFDVIARGNSREALVIVEEDGSRTSRTFDEMAARSDQLGAWLAGLGVGKGDAVMLMLGNQVELWEAMLAIMKLGAVILPTTTAVGTADLVDRVERGAVRHVIAASTAAGKFEGVPGDYTRIAAGDSVEGWHDYSEAFVALAAPLPHPGTAPHDPLLYYFTSGTTSKPKLVEHTQVSYPVGHLTTMYWLGLRPGDIHLAISSPGWAKHAWSCFFAPWIAEATVFVYNYARFDAPALLAQIRSEGVTSFCAPPTVWRMLILADLSGGPGALRELISAGEPLNPEVINRVRAQWGMTIRDGYGQTEMTAVVANSPGSPLKDGSMGRPMPGCAIALVDPLTGLPGDEGEICVDLASAPTFLMAGYVGDDDRNAEAMAGGYYHTGDIAGRDAEGYITYIGRSDDVFKASDYKISPFELESALIEHPAVAEAAIVPAPDAVRLAVPKAYVVLAPGFEPSEQTALDILGFARSRLAPFQRIRRIEFLELPKTISGKIRRVELREREEAVAAGTVTAIEWRDDDLRGAR